MKTSFALFTLLCFAGTQIHAQVNGTANPLKPAATAINATGIALLQKTPPGNALLSPYSIVSALGMTWAGASGTTRDEMAATLHFPQNPLVLHNSLAVLRQYLEETQKRFEDDQQESNARIADAPFALSIANRLFAQSGFDFNASFLSFVQEKYKAPLLPVDFAQSDETAKLINDWVAERTRQRITGLVTPADISGSSLLLVNTIYFKAVWDDKFEKENTKPGTFHLADGQDVTLPMMLGASHTRYAARNGYTAVTLGYAGHSFDLVILVPDKPDGLPALEAKLTPEMLDVDALDTYHMVTLWLPKFKMQPPTMNLGESLQSLGMKAAFDIPKGSADFSGMVPRKGDRYLFLSKVLHKTFISIDEDGTEAAGATAVSAPPGGSSPITDTRKELHVDRPFLFAIEYGGACLFIGRVTDPR